MEQDSLLIIATGGTLDKSYGFGAGVRDLTFAAREPAITDILQEAKTLRDYAIFKLMAKDSLDMTDEDRQTIAKMCQGVPQNRILITHGTDTMIDTAKEIASHQIEKTIVLTGASQPAIMRGSDAPFNVGFALNGALLAPNGVYIAINARLYQWDKCKKNPSTGIFEPI